jgi:DNA (cytosine-5)-methyltransferase 1
MIGPFAYYNEFDPAAAAWLRNLIACGLIAPGVVDTRSITEVQPDDLIGFTQVHLFAGIGGWSRAARLAGSPDARPLWSASCPCQPFSVAGKGAGRDDPRHLWPHVIRLAGAARPVALVGEQVAGKAGYDWFDGVAADLEAGGYACRAVDVPACAVDAPHIRSRQYWVAVNGDMANANEPERRERDEPELRSGRATAAGAALRGFALGDASGPRLEGHAGDERGGAGWAEPGRSTAAPDGGAGIGHNSARTFWSDHEWLTCHDGKARRTKSGLPLLVNGVSGGVAVVRPDAIGNAGLEEETRLISRIAAWKGFGNAIVPQLAAEVIAALAEAIDA